MQEHLFHVGEPEFCRAAGGIRRGGKAWRAGITKAAGIFALRLARVRKFNVSKMQSSPGDVKSRAVSELS
jgi:hypothetical protein